MQNTSFVSRLKANIPNPLYELLLFLKHAGRRLPNRRIFEEFTKDKCGVEIGGPSLVFRTKLPIYQIVKDLDGVNFSGATVWEGAIQEGKSYNYIGTKNGFQLLAEATNLSQIGTNTYDFLLSSNCLEHVANPIKALFEWKRVVKFGGAVILVLPNSAANFDHRRAVTSFDHIVDDFNNNTGEDDLTHLEEILALHDLSMDPPAGNIESFRKRSLDNFINRTLHHHVFDMTLIQQLLAYVKLDIVETSETRSDFFAMAVKMK
jgi:SAM-dependent methyltransferase